MSWIDQAKNDIVIFTGDGKEYRPLWKDPKKNKDFNASTFEFPEIKGSFVSRGTAKGRKIPLEIYFVGEDHLDQSDEFETSSDDQRPWVILHPYYGTLTVQPISIDFDHTEGNVSKLSIATIETITEDNPKVSVTPTDKIISDVADLQFTASASFVTDVPKPDTLNRQQLLSNTTKVYEEGKKGIVTTLDAEQYFNLFSEAQTAILNVTDYPLQAMNSVLAIIHYPSQVFNTVENRINTLKRQFDLLRTTIENLLRPSDKIIYEKNAGSVIATMAEASVTNIDYKSSIDVLTVMDTLVTTYNQFVGDIDGIQTDNGGDENSYIPDHDTMIELQAIIDFTVANLISIALNSKQERSIILEQDSTSILLAHRFYGLEPDDSTIDYFIQTNNLGLNENLIIKKGRQIKYYV